MEGPPKDEQRAGGRLIEVSTREPASDALHPQDSKDAAVARAREVLARARRSRPPGSTWVSLGEAVAEAVLRMMGADGDVDTEPRGVAGPSEGA